MVDEGSVRWPSISSREWPDGLYAVSDGARLTVGASAGQRIQVTGIGRFFPKNEVHVENSISVMVGDQCSLISENHFHVYQATIDFGVLLDPPQALQQALEAMAVNPDDRDAISEFTAELRRAAAPVSSPDSGVEDRRVAPGCLVSIADNVGVQIGVGNHMNVSHQYVIEQVSVPFVELLTDREVVTQFAHTLNDVTNLTLMADFLRAATAAYELVDHETLLATAEPRGRSDAILHSLFGRAHIDHAEPVMIGVDNELTRTTEMHLPKLRRRDFATTFDTVLEHIDLEALEPEVPRLSAIDHVLTDVEQSGIGQLVAESELPHDIKDPEIDPELDEIEFPGGDLRRHRDEPGRGLFDL